MTPVEAHFDRVASIDQTRAALESTGLTAKAFIAARINLEAKRLLTHSSLTLDQIAERLGSDDSANFSKFFRKDAACAPAEFRRRQQVVDATRDS